MSFLRTKMRNQPPDPFSPFSALLLSLLALPIVGCGAPLELHTVPTPAKSYRLLAMSMDDAGFIWTGSIHRVIHRYDPRTGAMEDFPMPYDSSASNCICAGGKVYVLGQSYPRLIIFDRTAKSFSEAEYPSPKPDVWYGTEAVNGRHLYLFDRGSTGVIKWDTQTDTGMVIPYPYKTIMPSFGRYVAADQAIWCAVWDYSKGQYEPIGIARLDLDAEKFSGWFPFPTDDTGFESHTDPQTTLFYPHSLKGKLVPFDFKVRRWCKFITVPEYGNRFGFIGLATAHQGRWFFSLSTYNGSSLGCDGKPYHFCNAVLDFDPKTNEFAFPTLEAVNAYYQVSYTLSAGGHFFATGSNIREADGSLNQARAGEVVFWQTRKPD